MLFKTAYRNLRRNKSYAIINILGLAVGIGTCLILFIIVQFHLSFDRFHKDEEKIYRVASRFDTPDGVFHSSGVPFPVANGLRIDYPELEKVAAIYGTNDDLVSIIEQNETVKKFKEKSGVFFAEPEFFQLFNFPLLLGDVNTALTEPNTGIVTKETAERYFGSWKTAIGRTLKLNNKEVITITGVLKPVEHNTDFPFKLVISYASLRNMSVASNLTDWVSTYSEAYCFVKLPGQLTSEAFNKSLVGFTKKHKPAEYVKDGFIVHPLRDMHFDNRFGNYNGRTFSKELITALSLIGVFILIIACVNYVNLATAQAVNRSKEVGVRKVLGSNRRQLGIQFLSETSLITLIALMLATLITWVALPFINELLDLQVKMSFTSNPWLIVFLIVVGLLVTLLSGLYPAVVIARFNPIVALKTKMSAKFSGGVSIRKVLVALQFTISHILIIGTLIVINQMDYFRNASLGFDKSAILTVPIPGDSISETKIDFLRDQLYAHPGIKTLSFSFASPANNGNWNSDFKFDHSTKSTEFSATLKWADADYFKTYNLKFVAGRPYFKSDTVRELVVNEMLLQKLGIKNPHDALGKQLDFWDGSVVGPIVGVIQDFHSNSLRDPISPIVLGPKRNSYQMVGIKIRPEQTTATMAHIQKVWNKTYPEFVYEYEFFDDKIASFYKQENQLAQLYKIFAGIAIFISCLGLYGLVSFMAVQRTKEVGIRKVLGASIARIIYLFSKEFTAIIGISFLIAAPVAYFFMQKWLQDFTFRFTPGVGIFFYAITGSLLIAWVTVGYRAVKSAIANPVTSLRTE